MGTDKLFAAAYHDLGGGEVSSKELLQTARELCWQTRDEAIAHRAETYHARWGLRLLELHGLVWERMWHTDRRYYHDAGIYAGRYDADDAAECAVAAWGVACAMAVLWWRRRYDCGALSRRDAHEWLDAHSVYQLSMELGV